MSFPSDLENLFLRNPTDHSNTEVRTKNTPRLRSSSNLAEKRKLPETV